MGLPGRLQGFGRCCAALLAWLLGLVALPAIGPELPSTDDQVVAPAPAVNDELPAQRLVVLIAHPPQGPPAGLEAGAASSFSQLPAGALRAPGPIIVCVIAYAYDGIRVHIRGYVGTSDPVNRWDPMGLWVITWSNGTALAEEGDTFDGLYDELQLSVFNGWQRADFAEELEAQVPDDDNPTPGERYDISRFVDWKVEALVRGVLTPNLARSISDRELGEELVFEVSHESRSSLNQVLLNTSMRTFNDLLRRQLNAARKSSPDLQGNLSVVDLLGIVVRIEEEALSSYSGPIKIIPNIDNDPDVSPHVEINRITGGVRNISLIPSSTDEDIAHEIFHLATSESGRFGGEDDHFATGFLGLGFSGLVDESPDDVARFQLKIKTDPATGELDRGVQVPQQSLWSETPEFPFTPGPGSSGINLIRLYTTRSPAEVRYAQSLAERYMGQWRSPLALSSFFGDLLRESQRP